MKVLKGISTSRGYARGTICLYSENSDNAAQHYGINDSQVDREIARFLEAKKLAIDSMNHTINQSEKILDSKSSDIFKSHLMILKDNSIQVKVINQIRTKLINAEHAVSDTFDEYFKQMSKSNMHFAELSHDIIDIRNRLITSFGVTTGKFDCALGDREAVIVATKRLTPSIILNIPKENVLAFVTEEGGFTTHATILANGYNVPVIFGIDVGKYLKCGDKAIVDGSMAKIFVSPDEKTILYYDAKIKNAASRKAVCTLRRNDPTTTGKGRRIILKANISTLGEVNLLNKLQHDGVGLLRTEFLFTNKSRPPSEDEQYRTYRMIA
ncbi:MAG: phosphoenolpyruvate-utilizing N-terminal domain-containing protein, partial [bacterium]